MAPQPPAPNNPKIAILGAGFSGLRTAAILLQHKFAVTVFEARNRLGGRVAQSDELGHTVDLGPNWIHGSSENPILRIAQETGTALHAWDEEEAVYDSDGRLLDAEEAEEYGRLLWDDGLISRAFEYSEQHCASIDAGRSLYDFFEEKVEGWFTDLPLDEAKRKRRTLLQVCLMWGAYVGSPVQRQSLKFFWLEKTIEGENPFVAGTYAKILEAVARPVREGADVRLRSKVVQIKTRDREAGKGVTVHTADGTKEAFDEVIVTVPLGYLKRNHSTLFGPALPPRVTAAIENLGYGNLDKAYITFPSAFWNEPLPESKTATSTSSDPAQKTPNVTATTAPLHQPYRPTPKDKPKGFPGFTHYLPPHSLSPANPECWDQQCMNLAALPPGSAHPTLLFYIHGPCAAHIASLTTSETVEAFFTPYISLLPNYCATNPACKPTGILSTAWTNDELSGYGSYSNFQVGLEAGDEDIRVLREGVEGRRLWFAGEHTAPFDALGTTTGAYLSGEAVALRISKLYEREC